MTDLTSIYDSISRAFSPEPWITGVILGTIIGLVIVAHHKGWI